MDARSLGNSYQIARVRGAKGSRIEIHQAGEMVAESAKNLRDDWVHLARLGQADSQRKEPLKSGTVRKKRKFGEMAPETPLVGQGDLLDKVARWEPVVSAKTEGSDVVVSAGMGPKISEDGSCVIKDMLTGNPKADIPARPITPSQRALDEEEARWYQWRQVRELEREETYPMAGRGVPLWDDYREAGYYGL